MQSKPMAGHLAALFTAVVWGTTFISTKILLEDFRPVEILFFRFVLGYLVLLSALAVFVFYRGLRRYTSSSLMAARM